jgi:AcrR family transcriptional regulator
MSVSSTGTRAPERSRTETRARLRASAQSLFAARGLHAVTSHEIAKGAGVAAGTFYLHYRDKHELFRELAFAAIGELEQRLEAGNHRYLPAEDAARSRAEILLRFAEEHRDLVRVIFARGAEAASVGADVLDHMVARIESDFSSHGSGPLMHPTVTAQALVGMWARVVTWWAESPGRAPREAVVSTMVALQLSGAR